MRLDHFVINIDNDISKLERLKKQIEPLGFPFEPRWGKGTKGFCISNIWIGTQYFELLFLKRKDGGGWRQDWVEKYNKGHRGIIGICLLTDNLDKLCKELKSRGHSITEPERISFKWFFGLFKKTMPWMNAYIDYIPNTNLQIFFQETDSPEAMEKMQEYMVPNANVNGIIGINEVTINNNFSYKAWDFIKNIFPDVIEENKILTYDMGTSKLIFNMCESNNLSVEFKTIKNNSKNEGKCFVIENVMVIL